MQKKIIVLFSGTGTNLDNIAKYFSNSDINIIQTITNNANANGINISNKYNIPCKIINSKEIKNDEYDSYLIDFINKFEYDLIVLAGYMKIVSKKFIDNIKSDIINIHPSLLPKHKGLNAIQKSYDSDDILCGVTVHYVNENVDDGKIILQKSFDKTNLSFDEFNHKIKECEFEIFPKAITIALNNNQ